MKSWQTVVVLGLLGNTLVRGLSPRSSGAGRSEDLMKHETIYFGGGCFWCTEAIFQRVKGVVSVVPGYAGGHTANPTYEKVCRGDTGHAEVVRVIYDPKEASLERLLNIFWQAHDPTQRNRQGADIGTQYRSIILYTTEGQKKVAEDSKAALRASGIAVVTEIVPIDHFYPAEEYHRNYYQRNPGDPYCQWVIVPKLRKLKKLLHEKENGPDH